MTDIAKCSGELNGKVCPLRWNCFRWTAPAGERQSWLVPTKIGRECSHYWRLDDDVPYDEDEKVKP